MKRITSSPQSRSILPHNSDTAAYLRRTCSNYGKPVCSESPAERLQRHVVAIHAERLSPRGWDSV